MTQTSCSRPSKQRPTQHFSCITSSLQLLSYISCWYSNCSGDRSSISPSLTLTLTVGRSERLQILTEWNRRWEQEEGEEEEEEKEEEEKEEEEKEEEERPRCARSIWRWCTDGVTARHLVKRASPAPEGVFMRVCFVRVAMSPEDILKDKFTQRFGHYLLTLALMESQGKFRRPQNISGASRQNGVAAFSQTTVIKRLRTARPA